MHINIPYYIQQKTYKKSSFLNEEKKMKQAVILNVDLIVVFLYY